MFSVFSIVLETVQDGGTVTTQHQHIGLRKLSRVIGLRVPGWLTTLLQCFDPLTLLLVKILCQKWPIIRQMRC